MYSVTKEQAARFEAQLELAWTQLMNRVTTFPALSWREAMRRMDKATRNVGPRFAVTPNPDDASITVAWFGIREHATDYAARYGLAVWDCWFGERVELPTYQVIEEAAHGTIVWFQGIRFDEVNRWAVEFSAEQHKTVLVVNKETKDVLACW